MEENNEKNHLVWRRSAKAVAFSGPGPFYFFSAERVLISGLLMIWRLSRFRKSSFAGLHFFLQNGVFLSKTDYVASTVEEMGWRRSVNNLSCPINHQDYGHICPCLLNNILVSIALIA